MAVVSRTARITFASGTLGSREFIARAAVQDTAAGASVTVSITQTAVGDTPPAVPDSFTLQFFDDNGVAIRSIALTPGAASQGQTFAFTSNGAAGSPARAGTVELGMRVTKTTGGPTATYDWGTRTTPKTAPTGYTGSDDQGFMRATTTVELSASNAGAGGATPSVFAYPDAVSQRATTGAAFYVSRTLTLTFGPRTGASQSTVGPTFDRAQGTVDPGFPAARQDAVQSVAVPNATLTGLPATVFTATTVVPAPVDPRLTRSPLFQIDDNTYGTPPLSKNQPMHRRLTSQQGFLASRTTNARGEGVNGVTYDVALTPDRPGNAVMQTGVVTATRGGEAGWASSFQSWSSSLPGGLWRKTYVVTSPSGYTAGTYVINAPGTSTDYFLVAVDPDVSADLIVGGTVRDRHLHAGDALIVGLELQNSLVTDSVLKPDSDADGPLVVVLLKRPNADASGSEYLAADMTWKPTINPDGSRALVTRHRVPVVVGTGDQVFRRIFPAQVLADTSDVAITGRMVREGAAYQTKVVREVVDATNVHGQVEASAGPPGPQGPQGVQGIAGDRGPDGPTGPAGPAGPKGDRGQAGASGPQGPQGPAGAPGQTGQPGAMGLAGPPGERGPVGPSGATGPVGPKGQDGAAGQSGPQGPQGPAGVNGQPGPAGPQGPQGPAGQVGARGDTGPQGASGPPGASGPQGVEGPRGPQGPAGPQGATVTDQRPRTEVGP